jgi:hypothetical protein
VSLIWPATENEIVLDQPRLHALVVGVGDYPHLRDGKGKRADNPMGLSQVSTPPVTAVKITKWLIGSSSKERERRDDHHFECADCPLGSVEVLISPEQEFPFSGSGRSRRAERARIKELEEAALKWQARCAANKENRAFFYFCGHGIAKGTQFILPENFGDPDLDLWRNNIDFDKMRLGMRSCKIRSAVYFIDACRETPFDILNQTDVSGISLVKGSKYGDSMGCEATYYAASQGKPAHGPENDVSYFGQALLKCLDGAGSSNTTGEWVVDSNSLGKALGDVLPYLGRENNLELTCTVDVSGTEIVNEPGGAYVIARIRCKNKPHMDSAAEIIMQRGSETYRSAVGQKKPLVEKVPPGEWNIQIRFADGEAREESLQSTITQMHHLMPPIFEGVRVP